MVFQWQKMRRIHANIGNTVLFKEGSKAIGNQEQSGARHTNYSNKGLVAQAVRLRERLVGMLFKRIINTLVSYCSSHQLNPWIMS